MVEGIPEQVLLANPRGACIGVDRMIQHVEERLEKEKVVVLMGQPVHNDDEVARLQRMGAILKGREEQDSLARGTNAIYTAHGTAPSVLERAEENGLNWSNGACPYVTKILRAAKDAVTKGAYVLDISTNGHPEQQAVLGVSPDKIFAIENQEQAETKVLPDDCEERGILIVNQTTMSTVDTEETRNALLKRFPYAKVLDGICYATDDRQEAVRYLAQFVDLGIVVTGSKSHNGKMLGLTFEQAKIPAVYIRNWKDLSPEMYQARRIGITSSASTPETIFQGVVNYFYELGVPNIEERGVAALIEREKNIKFAPISRNPKVIL